MKIDLNIPELKPGKEVMAPPLLISLITGQEKQIKIAEKNAQLARTDVNTGLPNKRAWEEMLESKQESRHPLAIMMIDLDKFKSINDTYGHQTGDECIANAAKLIASSIRPHDDFLANLGGDEFGILVDVSNHDPAETINIITARLQHQFDEFNTHSRIKLHFSHGSAISTSQKDQPHDIKKLFHDADMSMYETKQNKKMQPK